MLRVPHHRQINEWTCGPASMAMALGAFGARASQAALAREAGTNAKRGTTRAGLVRTLRAHGLRATARHGRTLAEIERLRRDGRVVIVLYVETEADEAHYAVFLGLSRGRVLLNDPWHGPRASLARAEFLRRWRGTAKAWTRWACAIDRPVS